MAVALHPTSLDRLDEVGLGERVVEEAVLIDRAVFFDGTRREAVLDLDRLDEPGRVIAVLPQERLEHLGRAITRTHRWCTSR